MNRVTERDLTTLLDKIDKMLVAQADSPAFWIAVGAVKGCAAIVRGDLQAYEPKKKCSAVLGSYPDAQTCQKQVAGPGEWFCSEHLQED